MFARTGASRPHLDLVFYDTETTGTTTTWDQMLQFAAIRTDPELAEQGRIDVRCRLMPHVVPAPGALRVTGLTPSDLCDPTLPSHYQAVHRLHGDLSAWTPAIYLGWNSFRFDEPLLRQTWYQTLHPPFLTTSGGNRRGDVLRIAQAAELYAPGVLAVPVDARDRPTFRLDRLAPLNGCGAGNAHEALADAEATLCLARLIRSRVPELWRHLIELTDRARVREILCEEEMLAVSDFVFGRPYNRLVTWCGENAEYESELAVFDLAYAPEDYLDRPVEELVRVLQRSPKPILAVRTTAQPILMPAAAAPAGTAALRIGDEERRRRAAAVRAATPFHERVGQALARRFEPPAPGLPLEQRLYAGFPGDADLARMAAFHAADWPDRPAIAAGFTDDRLQEIARRLTWLESPDLLAREDQAELTRWAAERVLGEDPDVPWRTVGAALAEIDTLIAAAATPVPVALADIRAFLVGLADRWAATAEGAVAAGAGGFPG